jgi:carbon-monoxide dehydrogenase medium subunit
MLPRFELFEPKTLDEALQLLSSKGESVTALAGGTNLLPDLRARGVANGALVNLAYLGELRFIRLEGSRIEIGGGATLGDLLRSELIERYAPSLYQAAKLFAGQMVRNAATVAGNICYGSPSADVVPPLLTLDATVTLTSTEDERQVPLGDFTVDYKKTVRRPTELMTAIHWPLPDADAANLFYKLGLRKGDAITVVGAAINLRLTDGLCNRVRIALGSVAPTVFRATEAERMLEGNPPSLDLFEKAAAAAAARSEPIDDIRASKTYRLHTTRVLVSRLLAQAWESLKSGTGRADAA